ncbi:MAG TPA: SDR family NAD(P)-dependent oxidoreductase, partial [Thermoanaerobaculia bacterium]
GVPAQGSAAPVATAVHLYDAGNGIFSIEIAASRSSETVAHLLQALERVQQEASAKVLLLSGIEYCFLRGGREELNDAIDQQLFRKLAAFAWPVVATLPGDVLGAGFLAAALCDFVVCADGARYGFTDADVYPTPVETNVFAERFGETCAHDLLFGTEPLTGLQLRARGWSVPVLPWDEVEAHGQQLAATLATKSQTALRLLKAHLTRRVAALAGELTRAAVVADAATAEQVFVVDAATAEQVFVARNVHDLARDLSGYKAVVLLSEGLQAAEAQSLILDAPVPVVAALTGDARGNAWLAAQFCEAVVYSSEGVYSAANVAHEAVTVFARRLGTNAAREVVLTGSDYTGAELQKRFRALNVVEQDEVRSTAIAIAAGWVKLPRPALAAWKQRNAATLNVILSTSQESDDAQPLTTPAIALRSKVVTATAQPDGIVVVKMEDRDAKNMFSEALVDGIKEAFARIEALPGCKAVVLTGFDSYFASGGTKETLLAIQQGTVKFTDDKIFQAALDCSLPVIAAMQGHGIGAGWCLGLFADLVVLSEESTYVSPYMNYGFTPGAGATYILPRTIGRDLAAESLLTGETTTGRTLHERGAAVRIVPRAEVLPAAMTLAQQVARMSRGRLIALKQQWAGEVRNALEETYRAELAMHEATFVGRSDTLAQIEQTFAAEAAPQAPVEQAPVAAGDLLPSVTATLRTLLANELLMSEIDIDENTQFVDLGLDSIGGVSWIRKINEKYRTTIEAVKVYSYPTLAQLSRFVKQEAEQNGTLTAPSAPAPVAVVATPVRMPEPRKTTVVPPSDKLTSWRGRTAPRFAGRERTAEPIAVIGMAGQFPQARNVEEFWRNIAEGRNCISEVPRQRWDVGTYYQPGQPVAGKTYSQWLGALEEYDLFDPLFFNISPAEAELMDPQQRLFLQAAWHSIENAGYAAQSLSGTKCGVFVGCAAGDYHQQSRESALTAQGFTGSATSILAARISYHLNLQGPCISIDTACSSSLVAIAEACDSLLAGDSEVALAGGVCVLSGPDMHIKTSQAGMLSPEGKCFTFDQRADGFVPGEGVGVVVLKRLSDAQRDGDVIHGVIEGWGVNQDGKTNGITAPNPESQTRLEQSVYDKHGIDPANIQLIEAHGTGTKLGDPIEVDGLKQAFRKYTQNQQYCAIGSVKSNIGHTLTAAGIAGVIKLLLALQHRQLPPTINFEKLNEHIDLGNSPFYVNDRLQEWTVAESVRRQAAISSFGFSGTNAHVVVGEYVAPVPVRVSASPVIVPLSARTPAQLEQKVAELLSFVRAQQSPDLAEIAWTLQAGREAMEERLGFVVSSVEQLIENLQAFVNGDRNIAGFHHGQVKSGKESLGVVSQDEDVRETLVEKWIAQKKLAKLLDLWVKGISLDWSRLYGEVQPRRIALPNYPFAKERYWLTADAAQATEKATAVLHPLLHTNTSDFGQQSYRSTFSGSEFFLTDHQVRTGGTIVEKVLPGMAYLEMARAAIELALRERPAGTVLELHDIVWAQPVIVAGTTSVEIALLADDAERVEYEIFSGETVHCTGRALLSSNAAPEKLDLDLLAREMTRGAVEPQSVYAACDRMGLFYGPSFRAIANVQRGSHQVLAQLRLPKVAEEKAAEYVLHPSLLDSALQAAVGLAGDLSELSSKPRLPFALDTLRVVAPCSAEMYAWIRYASGSSATDNVVKLNIDLCDAGGNVCVQMRGMALRVLTREAGRLLATPVWQASEPIASLSAYAERHVLDYVSAPASGYSDCAVACFEKVQSILQGKPAGDVLVQVVVAREEFAGLSALLKTAALENPSFVGQLIQVSPGISAEELHRRLEQEDSEPIVRYQDGVRQVVRWEEIPAEATNVAWKEDGVYLITGGRGGLGQLFATDILAKTRTARVILTGRGSDTRSASDARVSYRQVDLTDRAQVRQLVDEVRPTGILHCAGMIADSFVIKKSAAEFRQVLEPKVTGTLNLDEATRDLPLDFFVLFSSVAGAMGNVGQADYAAANGFLDRFAVARNRRVAAGERQGRTRSINWPLWQAGGMAVDATSREALQRATGMQPMQTATGLEAFHRILALPHHQVLVGEGDLTQMRRALAAAPVVPVHVAQPVVETDGLVVETDGLADKTREYLRKQFAGIIKLPAQSIDPQAALEKYGIDSILAMKLTAALETTFGPLSKTLFFEYQTIHELAAYLVKSHGARLATLFATATPAETPVTVEAKPVTSRRLNRLRPVAGTPAEPEPIAIIGLSGRYPEAVNVEAYWQNLRDGKDCITEVPKERWNWREYFSEDRTAGGHHYSKWGGFISGVDEFDALFFNISPKEAKFIDPQERLFLQHAWMAIEDAGYTRAGLQTAAADDLPGQVGVYAGVMYTEYQLFGAEANARGQRIGVAGSAASVANRVSYALNLHGPSLTLDTMCSSSLTAIHLACQDLRQGRTSMAIAGGVNVSIHPNKYLMLSAGQFISSDGHCQSFGEGGDGYIPGEGVGVVVLKRLSEAKRDGDHIYGIIRGSALNHGGKTNGYTV